VYITLNGDWVQSHCSIVHNPLYLCEWQVDSKETTLFPVFTENATLSRGYILTRSFNSGAADGDAIPDDDDDVAGSPSSRVGLMVGVAVCVVLGLTLSAMVIVAVVMKRRRDSTKAPPSNVPPPPPASDLRSLTISAPIFNSSTLIRNPRANVYELESIPLRPTNGAEATSLPCAAQEPSEKDDLCNDVYEDIPECSIYEEPTLQVRGRLSTRSNPPSSLDMGKNRPDSDYEDIDNIKRYSRSDSRTSSRRPPPSARPPNPPSHLPDDDDDELTIVDNDIYA
jgi:hypothetical protein